MMIFLGDGANDIVLPTVCPILHTQNSSNKQQSNNKLRAWTAKWNWNLHIISTTFPQHLETDSDNSHTWKIACWGWFSHGFPYNYIWLVVSIPLKNMKVQLGWLFPIYWKLKTCSKPPTRRALLAGSSFWGSCGESPSIMPYPSISIVIYTTIAMAKMAP